MNTANSTVNAHTSQLPDIAAMAAPAAHGTLNWVGMDEVELPILLKDKKGILTRIPAKAGLFVNLSDPDVKGIHMSRLYLEAQNIFEERALDWKILERTLKLFVFAHSSISNKSRIRLSFDYMKKQTALKSQNTGWRFYPVTLTATYENEALYLETELEVVYSSTCPCSAALARDLIQNEFRNNFAGQNVISSEQVITWLGREEGIIATPHSQRSRAAVKIKSNNPEIAMNFDQLISLVEDALQTPVQAAVKREDEQEFARLNGKNLMFCEDAGRKIKQALEHYAEVTDYSIKVTHEESLHPHDAVSMAVKGVNGGYLR